MTSATGASVLDSPTAVFVDLQTHTTASDGALPPSEVVAAAKEANLHAIAITDHDTVNGIEEAVSAGTRLGVRIVVGVELSCHFLGNELHLLGLHLTNLDAIEDALTALRSSRVVRAQAIVEALNKRNIPITLEAVLAEAGVGTVGRPHIARVMVASGWARDIRDAFDRWLAKGKPAFKRREEFDVADAIRLVHDAGGIAVWAHPGDTVRDESARRLLAVGLDGIEVLHPSHPPHQAERVLGIVNSLGLVPSGGSDWHGASDSFRQLGSMHVPAEWLEQQDALCAKLYS